MRDLKIDLAYLGILFIAFTVPFSVLINDIAIIIGVIPLLFGILFYADFRKGVLKNILKNKIALFFLALVLFYLLAGAIHWHGYSNIAILQSDLEKRGSFLVFPLILAIVPFLNKLQIKNILIVYFNGIILSSMISLVVAEYVTVMTNSINNLYPRYGVVENNFMYHRLGSYLDLHAVYYSSMVLLAFIMLMIYSRYHFVQSKFWKKIVIIMSILYLLLFLFLLKSVTILVALILIISCYSLFHLYHKRKKLGIWRVLAFLFLGTIILSALGYRVVDKVGERGNILEYDFSEPGGGQWNVFNLRKAKWDIAVEAIQGHWLIGVGPGNIHTTLDDYYTRHNFKFALREHYNPHNQFLHTFLTLGIVGFVIILAIYGLSFYLSIKRTDMIWFLFTIGFTLFSLSESTLAVNKGIVLFAFFATLMSYLPHRTSFYIQ